MLQTLLYKSSNILMDENFVAKVADFGLAHALNDGSICFEPVKTEIKGTLGYMDPEYVITQELIEKSMNKAHYYTNSFWTSSSSDSFWLKSIFDKKK
uniref:Protein kinase domain-containing protein n=1 Tax=Solanum lycopersicum TaxID=4081 RepID=K4AWY1_SOLLC